MLRTGLVLALALLLVGYSSTSSPHVTRLGAAHLRREWQGWVGSSAALPEASARRRLGSIRADARRWHAQLVGLRVYRARSGAAVPAVILAVAEPASWLRHRARRVLADLDGVVGRDGAQYVGVVDSHGRFVWETGRALGALGPAGGVWFRPDLDRCQPIAHGEIVGGDATAMSAR